MRNKRAPRIDLGWTPSSKLNPRDEAPLTIFFGFCNLKIFELITLMQKQLDNYLKT